MIMTRANGAAWPYERLGSYAQNCVESVCVPVGMSSRVAVSSVTAERNTRQNAAARPGPPAAASPGTAPAAALAEGSGRLVETDRRLGHRRPYAHERQREEQDRVADDEERRVW